MGNQNDPLFVQKRLRIRENLVTQVVRTLEGIGTIKARVGQEVVPSDILGESLVNVGFSKINLAEGLEVDKSHALKYLTRSIGSKIYQGEVLAKKNNFLPPGRKTIFSPADAVIESYNMNSGDLRLKFIPRRDTLISGVYGIVDWVTSTQVLIRAQVIEVYGVFGSGKQRFGILTSVGKADSLITPDLISTSHKRQILYGGGLVLSQAIRKAVTGQLGGIICGGINAKDAYSIGGWVQHAGWMPTDIGTSIIATEGFGPLSMGEDIFRLLRLSEGQFVFIFGNYACLIIPSTNKDSLLRVRKALIPRGFSDALLQRGLPPEESRVKLLNISVGDRVRLIAPPFMGSQGRVTEVDLTPTLLPSGLSIRLVTIDTKFRKVKVPFSNVELI